MILSAQQLFSDDQAITATAVSTNVIDLGVAGTPYGAVAALNQDVGKGAGVPVLIQVTEDFDNLTCSKCGASNVEVYSRITGYVQGASVWNPSKKQEFLDRHRYRLSG